MTIFLCLVSPSNKQWTCFDIFITSLLHVNLGERIIPKYVDVPSTPCKRAPYLMYGALAVDFGKLAFDLGDNARANGASTLTDSEAQSFLDSDRGDELNVHLNVIARHAHLDALVQRDHAGNVGGAEIELGTIVVEEGGMTTALVLRQDVNLAAGTWCAD